MNIETEHKFLICMPDAQRLKDLDTSEITQTYLTSDNGTERVRAREKNGTVTYTHTVKLRISELSSEEYEREITRDEYELLLTRKGKGRVIQKTRTLLPYDGHMFEIDIYPFWSRIAVMELEVESEDEEFTLPEGISVIREVTGDKRFSNHALSRAVPDENNLIEDAADRTEYIDMESVNGDSDS